MDEYKANSHKSKEEAGSVERKKVEKVIKGNARVRKNDVRKFADVFISEDVKNVKSYVLMDVLVPAIKKAIVDIVRDGTNMIFFGGTGARRSSGMNASKVSYRNYYDRGSEDRRPIDGVRTRYSYDDIVLDNRGEAEMVLDTMNDMLSTYGVVTVADLYDMVGRTGEFTDNKYGWTNLQRAEIVRVMGGGYMIKLPRAVPID